MIRIKTLLIYLIIFCLITILNEVYALNGTTWYKDGRSIALGGGMNAIEQTESSGIAINYSLPYNLKELSTRSMKFTYKPKWLGMEGFWSQTGNVVFMENYFAFGASRHLTESFILGVKGGYYHYSSINGTKGSIWLAEILCSYRLSEKIQVSIYLFNPTGATINQSENSIPMDQSFHFGMSYYPVKKTELLVEIEKHQKTPLIGHLGIETSIWESFILRAGLSSKPFCPSWGIGGKIHRFTYALGGTIHPVLGFSSCFSIQYIW